MLNNKIMYTHTDYCIQDSNMYEHSNLIRKQKHQDAYFFKKLTF